MILTTFFSKSKPINFILVGVYLAFFFGIAHYKTGFSGEILSILLLIASLGAYLFTMLGVDFVIKRNELGKSTTYGIMLFAVLTTLLPVALVAPKIIIANCAIVLAIRRIISLRSQREVQKKILDASLWIMVASVCYFWSILFFVLLFLGIALYVGHNYRNWLIPFSGVLASYILGTCISLLLWDHYFSFASYMTDFSIFYVAYSSSSHWIAFGLLITFTVFFLIFYLITYKNRQAKTKPAIILVIASLLIAILIVFIAPQKNTGELFFMTVPVVIMGTSYLESGFKPVIKEGLLWILTILPFAWAIF